MGTRSILIALATLAVVAISVAALAWPLSGPATATGDNSITLPDTEGYVSYGTSLALDAAGNPVVSYYEYTNGDLKMMHCNDANCNPAVNGPESITSPDTDGDVGWFSSLALDAAGNPVVSYYDWTPNYDLKVMHCNDANCDPAVNGPESITSPDTAGSVGAFSSLELDASGNPVVSYYDRTNENLKVLHCDDPNCAGDESGNMSAPDPFPCASTDTSLELDASGNPVVSYRGGNDDLMVLHCNDANCAGGDESITAPDEADSVGSYSSLELDASGNPVVSYYDGVKQDLKVVHCEDANCTAGISVTAPDTEGVVGYWTSLVLDAAGNPVVSYHDQTNGDLKVLHCGDANCTAGSTITAPDTEGGDVGVHSSLALDASGNPVVSYAGDGDLKVLRCADPNCTGKAPTPTPTRTPTPTPTPTPLAPGDNSITWPDTEGVVGYWSSLELDASGNPVISYHDQTNGDLKVLHCNDPNCAGGDESISSPDRAGKVGEHISLELDASGNPVVSYYDCGYLDPQPLECSNGDLKVLHCNDPNCAGWDESITSPDTEGTVGQGTSLALDASGNPVVSYYDYISDTQGHLKVLHCNDPNCAGGDESITSPDTDDVGVHSSLALDASGNPVVSYAGTFPNWDLKILHCDDPNCAGDESSNITSPDTEGPVGEFSSLALDASGNPVVSYHGARPNWDLKVLHCDDPNCAGDESSNIASPDTYGDVGAGTSLELDASGHPVVSYTYSDYTDYDPKVLHCGDPNCTAGNRITAPDREGEGGRWTSLALDASGNPVVSYQTRYPSLDRDLRVLHCGDAECGASLDKDGDGCTAQQETSIDPTQGGLRDYLSFWDFFDTPDPNADPQRDKLIRVTDIMAVVYRYGTDDEGGTAEINRNTDPLSTPPKTGYHPAYDRGGQVGPNPWDQAPADGLIRIADIMAVVYQYGHDCA